MAVDGTEGGWWSSNPGDKSCEFEVEFPRAYAVGELEIDWKWPPLDF